MISSSNASYSLACRQQQWMDVLADSRFVCVTASRRIHIPFCTTRLTYAHLLLAVVFNGVGALCSAEDANGCRTISAPPKWYSFKALLEEISLKLVADDSGIALH